MLLRSDCSFQKDKPLSIPFRNLKIVRGHWEPRFAASTAATPSSGHESVWLQLPNIGSRHRQYVGPCARSREELTAPRPLPARFLSTIRRQSGQYVSTRHCQKQPVSQQQPGTTTISADLQFRHLIESSADAILVVDTQGQIRYLNPAAEHLFNRDAHEMIGHPFGFPLAADRATEIDILPGQQEPVVAEMRVAETFWGSEPALLATLRDITAHKQTKEQLSHLAHHDALTGLPNRKSLYQQMQRAITRSQRSGKPVGVLFLDLDGFKAINDTYGHKAGDCLLQLVAARLKNLLRDNDLLARLGGDEFAICLEGLESPEDALVVARKILVDLSSPFELEGQQGLISASIGITLTDNGAADAATLLHYADQAMYEAKKAGRNTARFFSKKINQQTRINQEMAGRLRQAFDRQEFRLLFQPRIDAETRKTVAAEALLRWRDHSHGWRRSSRFIQIAETTGLLVELGAWSLEQACLSAAKWPATDCGRLLPVAVNISARQLADPEFVGRVESILSRTGLPPRRLQLELPASCLMQRQDEVVKVVTALHQLGVETILDDLVGEEINIPLLLNSGITTLSINRYILCEVPHDPFATTSLHALLSLTLSTDRFKVIVKGIEYADQLDFLSQYRGLLLQGFYLIRPVNSVTLQRSLTIN